MYPVLVVEGVARKEIDIRWKENGINSVSFYDENNNYRTIYNATDDSNDSEQMDLTEAIQWHGRYDPINEAVSNMIDENNTDLQNLAIQYIENDKPFAPNEYQSKYTQLKQRNFGLMDVQELIFEAMQEDVDLSGDSDG